jgi:hypothetical protein
VLRTAFLGNWHRRSNDQKLLWAGWMGCIEAISVYTGLEFLTSALRDLPGAAVALQALYDPARRS